MILRSLAKVCVLLVPLGSLHAQPILPWPPPWNSASIQTIGGISYFTFNGAYDCCEWLEAGVLTRDGNTFILPVARMRGEVCPDWLCDHLQTNAVVVGALPPGRYHFAAFHTFGSFFSIPRELVFSQPFEVSADAGSTLKLSRTDRGVELHVSGVAAAEYEVQASANLMDWTRVLTATGAPFTFVTNTTTASQQFFRVAVSSGSVNAYVPR